MGGRQAPELVYLRWCPTCDRTDRVNVLSDRHHVGGKRCDGTPVQLAYKLTNSPTDGPT